MGLNPFFCSNSSPSWFENLGGRILRSFVKKTWGLAGLLDKFRRPECKKAFTRLAQLVRRFDKSFRSVSKNEVENYVAHEISDRT